MNRTRYLPPGSMRRQRRLGRLEGSVGTLLLVCAIGAGLVSATPAEMYRPAAATVRPDPIGHAAPDVRVDLPPCIGTGKDCTEAEPDGAVTLLPRTGPQAAPLPQTQHQAHHIPEPGTLALISAGLAAIAWRKS
ncbi:MAG: PEP-CTERM sorting domain-containing protein [Pseudomonadales bacterium]|nr:PEP-CTERM sorting domain-containing protein [Pseudomonadales bacterium]